MGGGEDVSPGGNTLHWPYSAQWWRRPQCAHLVRSKSGHGKNYLGDGIGSRVDRMEGLLSKDAAEVGVQGFESKAKEIFEERGEHWYILRLPYVLPFIGSFNSLPHSAVGVINPLLWTGKWRLRVTRIFAQGHIAGKR